MIKIIGITGRARAGKDTVANILMEEIPCTMRYALADPIKDAMYGMLGANDLASKMHLMQTKEDEIPWLGHSPRAILQELGGTLRENLSTDFWIRFLDRFIYEWKQTEEVLGNYEDMYPIYVVVPDVRYNNEAEYIKEKEGIMIHVVRPDTPDVRSHSSEQGVSKKYIDHHIDNDGTIDELCDKVSQLVKEGELNE